MSKPLTKHAMLRASHVVLPSASQFCNYAPRVCMRTRVAGYDFCIRHILEDKNSPYKQCTYVSSKTNHRCTAAVPRIEKRDGFCAEHARRMNQSQQRPIAKTRRPKTLRSLVEDLSHYTGKTATSGEVRQKNQMLKTEGHQTDFASESDSEPDLPSVRDIRRNDEESDMDSIDSEQEDPLKHAGIYTAEEVALILRDKLIHLQSLYIDQFRYLHHMLREKRRKYLHGLSQIEETSTGGNEDSSNLNQSERTAKEKLSALRRYQKHFGKEALLHRQCKQRRIAFSEGASHKPPAFPECTCVQEDGVKCTKRRLPLSKLCINHITLDSRQVLFRKCNHDDSCCRSIIAYGDSATCDLHQQLQPMVHRYCKKQDETEMKDEPVDVVGLTDVQVDLCHDLSCDLSRNQSCLKDHCFTDKFSFLQRPR